MRTCVVCQSVLRNQSGSEGVTPATSRPYCPNDRCVASPLAQGLKFRIDRHSIHPWKQVVELWQDGVFIGQIVPEGSPGTFRVITKFALRTEVVFGGPPQAIEISIDKERP